MLALRDAWGTISEHLGKDWQGHSFAILAVKNFFPPMQPSIADSEIYRDAVFLVGRGVFKGFSACLAHQTGVYFVQAGTFGLWGPNPREAFVGQGYTLLQGAWNKLPDTLNKIHPSQWLEFDEAAENARTEWAQNLIPVVAILRA
jgi:hypothetical protein